MCSPVFVRLWFIYLSSSSVFMSKSTHQYHAAGCQRGTFWPCGVSWVSSSLTVSGPFQCGRGGHGQLHNIISAIWPCCRRSPTCKYLGGGGNAHYSKMTCGALGNAQLLCRRSSNNRLVERKIPGSNPASAGIFSGSSHTRDLKIGTPAATLPEAWRYRVGAGTGWPGVSIL